MDGGASLPHGPARETGPFSPKKPKRPAEKLSAGRFG